MTLAGFAGGVSWIVGLASPFRVQWLIGAMLALSAMTLGRKWFGWRSGKAWIAALLALVINGWCAAPLWRPVARPVAAPADKLTVLSFNPNYGNHTLDDAAGVRPIARMIESSGAQIVVICEITQHRLGVLARALPGYRLAVGVGRPDPFGIAIFISSAAEADGTLQLTGGAVIDVTQGESFAPQAEVHCRWRGKEVSVLALHTVSSVHRRSDHLRVPMMKGAARWANQQKHEGRAAIIAGDYNATPWCSPFMDMLEAGDLVNSQLGFGMQGTWPAPLPPLLRIPIDHCLHSRDLVTLRRKVIDDSFGSDHLPLLVELGWR